MPTLEELQDLCAVAKLSLPREELEDLRKDMEAMISFAQRIETAMRGKEYEERPEPRDSRLREDKPACSLPRERVLESAPRTKDGFIVAKGSF